MTNHDDVREASDQTEEAAKDGGEGRDRPASLPEQAMSADGHLEAQEPEVYAQHLLAVVGGEATFTFLWQQLAGNVGLRMLLHLAEVGLDKTERDVWLSRTLQGCLFLVQMGKAGDPHITRTEVAVLTTTLKRMSGVEVIELLADTAHSEPADGWDALRCMAENVMLSAATAHASDQWLDPLCQQTAEWRKAFLRGLDEAYANATGNEIREQLLPIIQACVQIASWRVR